MRYLWNIIRNIMGVVGFILIYGAVGTSDYYVLEMGVAEPPSVGRMLLIGVLLLIPTVLHGFYIYLKECEEEDVC